MASGAIATAQERFDEAQRFEDSGRLDEAERAYRELLALYPGQPPLLARLALVLKARGALSEAEGLLRRAIVAAPGEAALHNNLGNVLRGQGRFADAEIAFGKAVALNPAYAEAHYNLGAVLEDAARADEALAAYRRAVELRPDHAAARVRIGAILHARAALADALDELDAAIAIAPQTFEAHYYRGLALAGLERFDEGAAALARASALRPDSLDALLALANNLKGAGRHDEALDALSRAIDLKPTQASLHEEFNRLAWMAGRRELFLSSFNRVRRQSEETPDLLFAEAQFRVQRDDAEGAEPLLRRALAAAPERADASALLGRLLARRGRFAESFDAFATAVHADPQHPAYRNEFGFALLKGGEPRPALEQFDAARALNPLDQLALGGVCLAYRALGDSRYRALVDLDSLVRIYSLPLPRGHADVATFNAALATELVKLHTTTAEPLDQTLRGGTQSSGLLFTRKAKVIEQVREQIAEAVSDYVGQIVERPDHPFLSRKAATFSFTHSWSCKLRSSGFHTNHVHPMGWISSAYYVSLPDALDDATARPGWLKFGESHLALGGEDRPERFVRPVVGHLVLFPSYFWHGTVPFESAADRLTIAFDVVPGHVDPDTIARGPY